MKIDLTKQRGTYTYELANNYAEIEIAFHGSEFGLESFKDLILEIVMPASNTASKTRFVKTVKEQANKVGLMNYINNAINRARNFEK